MPFAYPEVGGDDRGRGGGERCDLASYHRRGVRQVRITLPWGATPPTQEEGRG